MKNAGREKLELIKFATHCIAWEYSAVTVPGKILHCLGMHTVPGKPPVLLGKTLLSQCLETLYIRVPERALNCLEPKKSQRAVSTFY